MSEAFVLVFALGDKSFKVVHDWTACALCTGQRLETEASDARLFLFVFATQPTEGQSSCQGVEAPEPVNAGMHVCASQALMVSHRSEYVDSAAPLPPLLQSVDPSDCEFFSCDEDFQDEQHRLPVCDFGECQPSGVRARRLPSGGDFLQRAGPDLALRNVQDQVQDLPWQNCKACTVHWTSHLHEPGGLRLHHGARSNGFQHNDLACHRRSHPHGRRRDPAAEVQRGIPLRHQEGYVVEEPSSSQGDATCAANGAGVEHFRLYGQGDSSSEAEDCSDCHSRSSASCPDDCAADQLDHAATDNGFFFAKDGSFDFLGTPRR